jgi:hypothetical protein
MSTSVFEAAPARLVHKLAAAEVLLDGWRRVGEGDFRVATRWPREHEYYVGPDGRGEPMLLIESVRQCLPLLSHVAFDVPLDHHLVWETFGVQIAPGALDARRPLDEIEIEAHCDDLRVRGGRAARLTLSFVIRRHDERLATAQTRFCVQSPAVYRRIRGESVHKSSADGRPEVLPATVSPSSVGRWTPSGVLLSPTDRPDVWRVRADTRHPIHFDHPVDHMPGALLLDAALQAAHAAVHEQVGPISAIGIIGIECDFTAFLELDDACLVKAQRLQADEAGDDQMKVRVTFTQRGTSPAFSAVVTLATTGSFESGLRH